MNNTIHTVDLGKTDYKAVWDLQHQLFDLRLAGRIPDTLMLNEHNHVYTLGKSGDDNHLLANADELRATGAAVFHIDRGGDITYHGPGQIVGYPILDLNRYYLDVHRYLRDLEEVIIRTLADYGVTAQRDEHFTGVWAGSEKIAAIGVRVSHWITMHGFALNINTDLAYFDRIIPCGIFHKGVTSLERLTGRKVDMQEVSEKIIGYFGEVFGASTVERMKEEFISSCAEMAHSELSNEKN